MAQTHEGSDELEDAGAGGFAATLYRDDQARRRRDQEARLCLHRVRDGAFAAPLVDERVSG